MGEDRKPFQQVPGSPQSVVEDAQPEAGASASTIEKHKHSDTERLPAYSVHMDAIRATAAFLVLAGHERGLLFGDHVGKPLTKAGATTAVPGTAPRGAAGLGHQAVIVFFVLSGYLVGNSAWKAVRSGKWSWDNYLLQRLTRLWIVLIPALILGGCIDHAGFHFLGQPGSLYNAPPGQSMVDPDLRQISTWKVLLPNVFFLQTIHAPMYGTNRALWSLANEFWYYLAFPPILLALVKGRAVWKRMVYAILAVALLVFVGPTIASRFPIWLFGFVVSTLPLALGNNRKLISTLLFLQFIGLNIFLRLLPFNLLQADLLLGVSFSLFLYALVHARQPIGSMLYQHLATGFSKFSYTLYLVHLPLLTFLTVALIRPWHAWSKSPLHLLIAVMLVIVAYGYAYAMYLLFERNTGTVRRALQRGLKARMMRPATAQPSVVTERIV